MSKYKFHTALLILLATVLSFQSCSDDDVENPPNPNEEELITTVQLQFTDTLTQEIKVFKFADPDGDGGEAPTQMDTIILKANTFYNLQLEFLDESKDPFESITEEIEEEADEHLVCFDVTGNTAVKITDIDKNGLPIGLTSTAETAANEEGSIMVSLKHQPDVKDGSCAVGETDVEVLFQLKVVD